MIVELFGAGLIGDLRVDCRALRISRTGMARYHLDLLHNAGLSRVEAWTTAKASIAVEPVEGEWPAWLQATWQGPVLEELELGDCFVHLEHLDRPLYHLGIQQGGRGFALHLKAPGYLKTRFIEAVDRTS